MARFVFPLRRYSGGYKRTADKAHGREEIWEYYQTQDVGWITQRSEWADLKSIGMEKKTLKKLHSPIIRLQPLLVKRLS